MKTILMFAVLILASTARVQAAPLEVTSANLKTLVEERSARASAARLGAEAAREREGSFKRSFLPSVEVFAAQENLKEGREERKTQPAYGIEGKVNLFNGGRDRLEGEIRDLASSRSEFQGRRVISEELEKARATYWELLYLREKIGVLKSALTVNDGNLEAAERRIRSGVATETDRVEFEMKRVDLRRELGETELRFESDKRNLAVLLGGSEADEVRLPEEFAHEHDYASILKHKPEDHEFLYKENEISAKQSELSAKSNGRVWWPKLDVYAGYHQFNERDKESPNAADRTESVVGLRLSLSLPAGLESNREAAAQRKEGEASARLADFQKREVESHLTNEVAELSFLHGQIHDAEENIRRAERYDKLTRSEYVRGVKNSPDVLGSSEKLFDMRIKRLGIIRDFQVAKSHVLSKIGR